MGVVLRCSNVFNTQAQGEDCGIAVAIMNCSAVGPQPLRIYRTCAIKCTFYSEFTAILSKMGHFTENLQRLQPKTCIVLSHIWRRHGTGPRRSLTGAGGIAAAIMNIYIYIYIYSTPMSTVQDDRGHTM